MILMMYRTFIITLSYREASYTHLALFSPMYHILACLLLALPAFAQAFQQQHTNAATGALSWSTQVAGVHFALTQILPDQVNAFYVNRGFTLPQIRPYASACVYMTVLRNDDAPGVIHFKRSNWSVKFDGSTQKFVSVEHWMRLLASEAVPRSALVALRWAQFPPEQSYEPGGDWNQGMIALELPPGSKFDVTARWDIAGKDFSATLQGVECAN